MSKISKKIGGIAVVLATTGLVLAGCGRKGDLDKPSTPVEQQNIRKTGEKRQPEPASDRPFILDPLL